MKDHASEVDFEKKSGYITVSDGPVPVPVPPVADFISDTVEVDTGVEVHFTDTSTNNPDTWLWSFGDGEVTDEENPVHTYSEAGRYTVTLEVSNGDGSDTAEKIDYINVLSTPPVTEPGDDGELNAEFTADITIGSAPFEVHFTDASSGSPDSWTYHFGDGDTSYEQNPVHTYNEPGTYFVMLRVMKDHASEVDFEKKSGYIIVNSG